MEDTLLGQHAQHKWQAEEQQQHATLMQKRKNIMTIDYKQSSR